jgi:hypothetical protein
MKTAFLQHMVRQLLETILCVEKLTAEMALPEYGVDKHQNTSDYWLNNVTWYMKDGALSEVLIKAE